MLVRQLNLLGNRISILSEQLEILTKRLDLSLQAFDEGLITVNQVYDARDDLTQGKKGYLFAMLEYHQQWAMLQELMGKEIPVLWDHGDVVEFVDFCAGGSNLFLLKRKIGKTRFICQKSWLSRP